ncbi:MAG: 50S ribosomal protein L18 [Spirochaetia bacterium]|jgi:large subunit ribosomal protein L18
MKRIEEKKARQLRRKRHIRKTLKGTGERPRLTVYRSNKHLYVQVIDDDEGKTLLSVSTRDKGVEDITNNVEGAGKLGEIVGSKMKESKIDTIVFDRNGYRYHGIVKAIADGARKSGIKF